MSLLHCATKTTLWFMGWASDEVRNKFRGPEEWGSRIGDLVGRSRHFSAIARLRGMETDSEQI
jgi:hypothetical protein